MATYMEAPAFVPSVGSEFLRTAESSTQASESDERMARARLAWLHHSCDVLRSATAADRTERTALEGIARSWDRARIREAHRSARAAREAQRRVQRRGERMAQRRYVRHRQAGPPGLANGVMATQMPLPQFSPSAPSPASAVTSASSTSQQPHISESGLGFSAQGIPTPTTSPTKPEPAGGCNTRPLSQQDLVWETGMLYQPATQTEQRVSGAFRPVTMPAPTLQGVEERPFPEKDFPQCAAFRQQQKEVDLMSQLFDFGKYSRE